VTRRYSFAAAPRLQALVTRIPDAAAMAQATTLNRFTNLRGATPRLATQSP
jgi:hypothetical protein